MALSCVPQIVLGMPELEKFGKWHAFGPPNQVLVGDGYKIWSRLVGQNEDGLGGEYNFVVSIDGDIQPIVFYQSSLGINALLSHNRKLVLVFDHPTLAVRVIELKSKRNWRIDENVLKSHKKSSPLHWIRDFEWRTWPLAFSKDDATVLIRRQVNYIMISLDEYKRLDSVPEESYYVVETRTGKVLKQYRKDKMPKSWLLKLSKLSS